jgi:1,4-alpha-glucan branching enzyme
MKLKKTTTGPSCVALDLTDQKANEVFVVGSFNNWRPRATPMTQLGEGMWGTRLSLAPGRYEYQFLVDGRPIPDPAAQEFVDHPDGALSSVLLVGAEGGE